MNLKAFPPSARARHLIKRTYIDVPCPYCGKTPTCAHDCTGMTAALVSSGVFFGRIGHLACE